jgi:hypothetical protein
MTYCSSRLAGRAAATRQARHQTHLRINARGRQPAARQGRRRNAQHAGMLPKYGIDPASITDKLGSKSKTL